MKNKQSPRGRVFSFAGKESWHESVARQLQLSSTYLSHYVVVLGKAEGRPSGWVRVVTVRLKPVPLWDETFTDKDRSRLRCTQIADPSIMFRCIRQKNTAKAAYS